MMKGTGAGKGACFHELASYARFDLSHNLLSKRHRPCRRTRPPLRSNRRALLSTLAAVPALSGALLSASAPAQAVTPTDALPSWNDGAAKRAILDFVRVTTDPASKDFVAPLEKRPAAYSEIAFTSAEEGEGLEELRAGIARLLAGR